MHQTNDDIGRFLNKLFGGTDIEDALRRLDKLTQEESRMITAQVLKFTHDLMNGTNTHPTWHSIHANPTPLFVWFPFLTATNEQNRSSFHHFRY